MHIIKYPEKKRLSSEGIVVGWDKKPGDAVKNGEVLVQVEVSGELIQFEAPTDGTLLEVLANSGDVVNSGQPLAIIGQSGQDTSKIIKQLEQSGAAPVKQTSKTTPSASAAAKPVADVQTAQSTEPKKEKTMSSQSANNVIPILMPQAGQSMEEGTVLSWKVKEGDTIEVGQVIMEIETDKATMEVEATDAGRVARIVSAEGDVVKVKEPVAFLADNDADVDAYLSGGASAVDASSPAPAPSPAKTETAPPPAPEKSQPAPAPEPAQPSPPAAASKAVPIIMPQAGQSMEEGTILSWKVKEGDVIEVGQIIMEIETDKATVEVEAVDPGRVAKIVSQEGDVVKVNAPVAYLAEEGVDISAASSDAAAAPSAAAEATPVSEQPASAEQKKPRTVPSDAQVHPLSKMRRAIANNLLYSKQNIPHFYAKTTIDAGLLFTTYRQTKERFKCTINDFVTAACARVIRQYPPFRSQYQDDAIVENPAVNIGIAVGTDEGLTVPVVVAADSLPLEKLAARSRQVIESARNGKLEGMGQGVFTITNLGMFGVEEFGAIINPPESAILAVGAVREGVIVKDGAMLPGRLMTVNLSVDHRVIDGVVAAQFLKTLKELLEDPKQLVS